MVLFAVYKLHSVNCAAHLLDLSASEWESVCGGFVKVCVHVMKQSGDFPDSFAQWKPSCLPVYLFALLIADHTSYVTSPQILQVNFSLAHSAHAAAAGQYSLGGEISLHTSRHNHTFSHTHTHRWGDSDGWHYCSCVAPNGLLKWLIKGKQLRRRGTDGATPHTEAGTEASEKGLI